MLLYIEESVLEHPRTHAIIKRFPKAQTLTISNYKNIFDAPHGNMSRHPSTILAQAPKNPILKAPDGYGFDGDGVFIKTSLGCIYDCEYCYLKGMFRNEIPVYFVDYEYIWSELQKHITSIQKKNDTITYVYCSDYSDIQGMDVFSGFNEFFFPRIEKLNYVLMETRTKSPNIQSLLDYSDTYGAPKNIEISYSLNPQTIIDAYENGTASLEKRIKNIQTLLECGWKVGVRIMPLIPVTNYEKIYDSFLLQLKENIHISNLYSLFIGGLMFTKKDFKTMKRKGYLHDMLDKVDSTQDNFVRLNTAYRARFYKLFRKHLGDQCEVCLDTHIDI